MRTAAKIVRATDAGPKKLVANDNDSDGFTHAVEPDRARNLRYKRLCDIAVSLSSLIVLMPVLLLIAAMVVLESFATPIVSELRWAKGGKKFNVYKFRSMSRKSNDLIGGAARSEDRYLTKTGAFLRRTRLEELPQLFNVLFGDLSLVGPRCHIVGIYAAGALDGRLVDDCDRTHVMRPGLTGLAQLPSFRSPVDPRSRARAQIEADLHYIRYFTIGLDLKILIATALSEFKNGERL